MRWTGSWKDGQEIDLTKIPCNSSAGWGVTDCFACYWFGFYKESLVMALELALFGRTTATVSSRSCSAQGFWSLKPEDLSCDWWREKDNE